MKTQHLIAWCCRCLLMALLAATPRALAQATSSGEAAAADVERAKEFFRIGAAAYAASPIQVEARTSPPADEDAKSRLSLCYGSPRQPDAPDLRAAASVDKLPASVTSASSSGPPSCAAY